MRQSTVFLTEREAMEQEFARLAGLEDASALLAQWQPLQAEYADLLADQRDPYEPLVRLQWNRTGLFRRTGPQHHTSWAAAAPSGVVRQGLHLSGRCAQLRGKLNSRQLFHFRPGTLRLRDWRLAWLQAAAADGPHLLHLDWYHRPDRDRGVYDLGAHLGGFAALLRGEDDR